MLSVKFNVVISAGGKFHENDDKTFYMWVNFIIILILLIKSYSYYFSARDSSVSGRSQYRKKYTPPHENFLVYSNRYHMSIQ